MDSIYLNRFNSQSPLSELRAELDRLVDSDTSLQKDFVSNADKLAYSAAQRIASKLATVRAKKSYITRMVRIAKDKMSQDGRKAPINDYYGSFDV